MEGKTKRVRPRMMLLDWKAAVIGLWQHVTELLKTNEFVVIISTDYSKAFDTLRHSALAEKLNTSDIPDNIYNWF